MSYIWTFDPSRQEACEPQYSENIAKGDMGQLGAALLQPSGKPADLGVALDRPGSNVTPPFGVYEYIDPATGEITSAPGPVAFGDIKAPAKRRDKPLINAIRIKELWRLARFRYPDGIPDSEDGRALLFAI